MNTPPKEVRPSSTIDFLAEINSVIKGDRDADSLYNHMIYQSFVEECFSDKQTLLNFFKETPKENIHVLYKKLKSMK